MNNPISSLTDSHFIRPGDQKVSCKLYSINGQLLVTSSSFIGLQPQVVALSFPAAESGREVSKEMEILQDRQCYTLQLTTALFSGPTSGFHRLKVDRGHTTIIRYEWGGAHGGNYTKGNSGFLEGTRAALFLHSPELARFYGALEAHFLLLFRDIVIPQQPKEPPPAGATTVNWIGKIRCGDSWIHVRKEVTRRYASGYSVKEGGLLDDRQHYTVHTVEEVVPGNEFLGEEE